MEQWMRRLLVLPLVVLALVVFVAAVGAAQAQSSGNRVQPEMRTAIDQVMLQGDHGSMGVREVILRHQGKVYRVETRRGIDVRSQNRVSLRRVPLIGGLTDPPFRPADFSEERRVGQAFGVGRQLFIDLAPGAALPRSVAIFNRDFGFFLNQAPVESGAAFLTEGTPFGTAYLEPSGNRLLVMVRPSVIFDAGLW
jgi:hypothetical protein